MVLEKDIIVNVHKSYRWVVGVCDSDIYGRKLEEGEKGLDLSGAFFKGDAMAKGEAKEIILDADKEDATFNFVGEKSVALAKDMGMVKDEGVGEIEGIPFALVLL